MNRYDRIAGLVVRARDPRGLPVLDVLLEVPDGKLAREIGAGIALLGGASRREQLGELLRSSEVWKRAAGIEGLRALRDRSAVGELLLILESEDSELPGYSFWGPPDSRDPRLAGCAYYWTEAREAGTFDTPEAVAGAPPGCPRPPPPPTLHSLAAETIDELTGQDLDGDVPRIEAWIRATRRRAT